MQEKNLIYDWNLLNKPNLTSVELCDETLRDGIQSPSIIDPQLEHKLELITIMDKLKITIANIGLPAASTRNYDDVLSIAKFVKKNNLAIKLNCAGRTLVQDIKPIAQISQEAGIAITCYCFLGCSPIRQIVEEWSLDTLKKTSEDAISFALKENLQVAFVTEDTTRSAPNTLRELFENAINLGVERLVLCDTVGHATPNGVKNLIEFTQNIIESNKSDTKIDWHGHNDRGLALINALVAAQFGAHRIHGTALGIGERVGNTSIDQLIVNLKMLGLYEHNVYLLKEYVEKVAQFCQSPIPYNYPVFGNDAFKTATGVHAAAIIKALNKNNKMLADTVYSGVNASLFGKEQEIGIGPMSGASNVKYWLAKNNIAATDEIINKILTSAKASSGMLSATELEELCENLV